MTTMILPAKGLINILSSVLPLAATDPATRVVNRPLYAVHLRRDGNYLVATATDRYVLGMCREYRLPENDGVPDDFEVLLDGKEVKDLVTDLKRAVKAHRGGIPTVEVELGQDATGHLTLTFPALGRAVTDLEPEVKLPDMRGFLQHALARKVASDLASWGLNPSFMKRFETAAKVSGVLAVRMEHRVGDPGPILVTAGADFLGCIMPTRFAEDSAAPGEGWDL